MSLGQGQQQAFQPLRDIYVKCVVSLSNMPQLNLPSYLQCETLFLGFVVEYGPIEIYHRGNMMQPQCSIDI